MAARCAATAAPVASASSAARTASATTPPSQLSSPASRRPPAQGMGFRLFDWRLLFAVKAAQQPRILAPACAGGTIVGFSADTVHSRTSWLGLARGTVAAPLCSVSGARAAWFSLAWAPSVSKLRRGTPGAQSVSNEPAAESPPQQQPLLNCK